MNHGKLRTKVASELDLGKNNGMLRNFRGELIS